MSKDQQVLHGMRIYRRTVSQIHQTPTGPAGKVRIKGSDYIARHWRGDRWTSGRPWNPQKDGEQEAKGTLALEIEC